MPHISPPSGQNGRADADPAEQPTDPRADPNGAADAAPRTGIPAVGLGPHQTLAALGRQASYDDLPGLVLRVNVGAQADARPSRSVALVGPIMPGVAANPSALDSLILPALVEELKRDAKSDAAASRVAPGHGSLL